MTNKIMLGFLVILLVGLVFASGCIEQKAESVCGNNIKEAGEECDGTDCPSGQVCKVCQCVSPQQIPSPPPLPA